MGLPEVLEIEVILGNLVQKVDDPGRDVELDAPPVSLWVPLEYHVHDDLQLTVPFF